MSETYAVSVEGLTKRFGHKTVVDDFSMQIPKGSIYGFLGPNGSGKTTTIRMMCGLLRPDAGSGQALGQDIITQSREIKSQVGYMTQRFSLYEDLTVKENLDFMARLHSVKSPDQVVEKALEEYDLEQRAKQLAGELSGGWKQRLALAAASLHSPGLLLLDEPTAGVDPKARRDFWDRIRRMASQGVTVLVSTHYMDEAVQCDYIAFIAYGKKLIDAPAADIPAAVGLTTWRIEGKGLQPIYDALEHAPGVGQIARFGSALHVSGLDAAKLDTAIAPWRGKNELSVELAKTGLEEAFIWLMTGAQDNFQ
jgi:ABC-2 type transport system ATP-binding protein